MKRLSTFWNGKVTQQGTLARGGAETLLAGACSLWETSADSLLHLIMPSVNHRAGPPKQDVQLPSVLLVVKPVGRSEVQREKRKRGMHDRD